MRIFRQVFTLVGQVKKWAHDLQEDVIEASIANPWTLESCPLTERVREPVYVFVAEIA
jgi:hypothetical protein